VCGRRILFYTWRDDGTAQTIHDLLRWQVREKKGRLADLSLAIARHLEPACRRRRLQGDDRPGCAQEGARSQAWSGR
jgi:hypothetical protein